MAAFYTAILVILMKEYQQLGIPTSWLYHTAPGRTVPLFHASFQYAYQKFALLTIIFYIYKIYPEFEEYQSKRLL